MHEYPCVLYDDVALSRTRNECLREIRREYAPRRRATESCREIREEMRGVPLGTLETLRKS